MTYQMIRNTPYSERPRERCLKTGSGCLSLRECIALILGIGPKGIGCLGLAEKLLNRLGKGLSSFDQEQAFFMAMEVCGMSYLKDLEGFGPANQARLLAAFELGRRYAIYRAHQFPDPQAPRFSQFAQKALEKISSNERFAPQEWLGFIPTYRSGKLGELCIVERGVRTHVNTDPVEFFACLLALRPRAFFLVHNHPSGNTTPSFHDIELTKALSNLAGKFGILLLGHWVVGAKNESWIEPSLLDES